MSKKGTIEDQVKALSQREEKLKLQLDNDSDEMKDKAMRVGKIALIAGGVALLGYFIFNTFFGEDEEEEEEEKPKKKRRSSSNGITSRITALALPYLEKVVSGIMEEVDAEEPGQKKEKKEDKEES